MSSLVFDTLIAHLPAKRKTTPSGWTSFNAPCCPHNGTTQDTRQRGGLITNPSGGVSVVGGLLWCTFPALGVPPEPLLENFGGHVPKNH